MTVPITQYEPSREVAAPFSLAAHTGHDATSADPPDDLLRWLLRFPLLRVDELACVSGISRSRVYARLSRLQDNALVTRWRAPVLAGAGTHLYALTPLGLGALATAYGPTVWRLARHWQADDRGVQRLLLRASNLVMAQSVVVSLLRGASQALRPRREGSTRAANGAGSAHVEWNWLRHYPLRFTHRSHSGCVRLDAYVRFVVDMPIKGDHQVPRRRCYGLFVLADSGVADALYLRHLLRALTCCRDTFLDHAPAGVFPPVLILTTDAHRAARWQALAVRFTTEQWQTHSLVGAIFCTGESDARLPWQAAWRPLASGLTCHLTDVLVPVDEMAKLPPLLALPDGARGHRDHGTSRKERHRKPRERQRRTSPSSIDRLAQAGQQLDPRHMSALRLLYEHPLLSACDLAAFLGVAIATADRYLRLLTQLELISDASMVTNVNSVGRDPDASCEPTVEYNGRYVLTRLGLELIAACAGLAGRHALSATAHTLLSKKGVPTYMVRYEREVTSFAHVLAHTAEMYGFFAQLATSACDATASGVDHHLLWWETGRACERYYREIDGWHAVRPDGAGEYQAGPRRLRFWLEWDRGTMNQRDLEIKFAGYAHYLRSREWWVDGNAPLPVLLVVTTEERQATRIAEALSAALPPGAGNASLMIHIAQRALLTNQGPLGPIWRQWTPSPQFCTTHQYGRLSVPNPLLD